ncbi:PH domain-containing protein [Mycobacterium sp. NBC_00419]|uniref:PH domain-containing protein n=1 Tax=Mycobacterium sp. NBC_00419 TaxID=2975989 RepID=UPI002E1A0BDD
MPSGFAPDPTSATTEPTKPVVIRMSPMAHFASGFLALALMALIPLFPAWGSALLAIPVVASVAIVRLRTVANRETVTARSLLGSRTVRWDDVQGLRFDRNAWAKARLGDDSELRLPAVTFATLPLLTAASGGRVPNPYE